MKLFLLLIFTLLKFTTAQLFMEKFKKFQEEEEKSQQEVRTQMDKEGEYFDTYKVKYPLEEAFDQIEQLEGLDRKFSLQSMQMYLQDLTQQVQQLSEFQNKLQDYILTINDLEEKHMSNLQWKDQTYSKIVLEKEEQIDYLQKTIYEKQQAIKESQGELFSVENDIKDEIMQYERNIDFLNSLKSQIQECIAEPQQNQIYSTLKELSHNFQQSKVLESIKRNPLFPSYIVTLDRFVKHQDNFEKDKLQIMGFLALMCFHIDYIYIQQVDQQNELLIQSTIKLSIQQKDLEYDKQAKSLSETDLQNLKESLSRDEQQKQLIQKQLLDDEQFHGQYQRQDEEIKSVVNKFQLNSREKKKQFTVKFNKYSKQYQ